MARESRLWEFLREGWKPIGLQLHYRRLENQVGSGDPDVDGCYLGWYFEIELKGTDRPAHPATAIDLGIRKSQVIYHRKRMRANGNHWLYVRVGIGKTLKKYLVPGRYIGELEANPPTEQELEALAVLPPSHSAWDVLKAVTKHP
jgi:hypothetical protein